MADARWLRSHADLLAGRFDTRLSIVERPNRKRAIVEIACRTKEQGRALVNECGGKMAKLRRDWLRRVSGNDRSKLSIGSRLVILRVRPKRVSRSPTTNARLKSMIIPAETAFGTGEHTTTAMCLRLLERITRSFRPGWTMLDAGTGSGILAIAGSYFGATQVFAIDNDPIACATAMRNARANDVRNIEVTTGDVLKQKLTKRFDIITANLFSEILIDASPIWSQHLAPEGRLIFSGILRSQERSVIRALRKHRLVTIETRRRGKWMAGVAMRSRDGDVGRLMKKGGPTVAARARHTSELLPENS